jgi:hypothetical protein
MDELQQQEPAVVEAKSELGQQDSANGEHTIQADQQMSATVEVMVERGRQDSTNSEETLVPDEQESTTVQITNQLEHREAIHSEDKGRRNVATARTKTTLRTMLGTQMRYVSFRLAWIITTF